MGKIKIIFSVFFLLGSLYACKDVQAESNGTPNSVEHVSVEEMKLHLQMEDVQLIDIRTREEYNNAHILDAKNIVFDEKFRKKLDTLDKFRPVLLYCTDGSKSKKAIKILKRRGFQNVQELDHGFTDWKAKGEPITKSK